MAIFTLLLILSAWWRCYQAEHCYCMIVISLSLRSCRRAGERACGRALGQDPARAPTNSQQSEKLAVLYIEI